MSHLNPLPAEMLRWICDPQDLPFKSTADVEPMAGIVGQPLALDAIKFGIESDAPGQNIYVRGLTGTGRMSMVERLLTDLKPKQREKKDRCYVRNFGQPDRPRLISLPSGQARSFRRRLRELADFIATDLNGAMNSDALQVRRVAMQEEAQQAIQTVMAPFEAELREAGLALVQVKAGQMPQPAIFPTHEGKPIAPEQFEQLVASGQISKEAREEISEKVQRFSKQLPRISHEIGLLHQKSARRIQAFNEQAIKEILRNHTEDILNEFQFDEVSVFLQEVVEDLIDHGFRQAPETELNPHERYGVNILLEHECDDGCPIVVLNSPNITNLLGTVEASWGTEGPQPSDYRSIRGGALLRADGGYLVLDASDTLREPGAWQMLMRALRTGHLEIVPSEMTGPMFAPISLKPEPIPIHVRVILVGSAGIYYRLDQLDPDFREQFKVLADFDNEITCGIDALHQYAGVLSRIVKEEGLRHFDASGIAALAEHGARIASKNRCLTTRFGRVADIAREADYVAGKAAADQVMGDHVREAVSRTKSRANLPSVRFQSLITEGTINIQTRESVVGQINGLAVMQAGQLAYGFPARITATIGAGQGGVVDIEGLASMSGSIHTKGFHILGGLLRHLLGTDHPLAFSASIAFEQSYGGIDGDSASGAEICCLLSALTDVPIRQEMAMTGAIDQHGRVQAIGGVNEKVEGFFDICNHFGLTGNQGVLIPQSNANDLMLRHDVVEACRAGQFQVFAVSWIHEALEILTGVPAGERTEGEYPENTLLHTARLRARTFWEETVRGPGTPPA